MILKKILYASFLPLLWGCSSQSETPSEVKNVRISLSNDEVQSLLPDSIFASVEYIPLETTSDNLIGGVDKTIIVDSCIYILDRKQKSIFKFDSEGRYVKKLDNQGGGDGYYIELSDFQVENDLLYILCPANKSILIYDLDFNYVKNIRLDSNYSHFLLTNEYIYLYSNFQNEDFQNIVLYDRAQKEIHSRYSTFPKEQLGVGYNASPFSYDAEACFACYPYQYAVYKLYPDREEKVIQIQFDDDKIYPVELQTASSAIRDESQLKVSVEKWPISCLEKIISTKKYYILSFIYMTLQHTVIYNKETGNIKYGVIFQSPKFPFVTQEISYCNEKYVIQIMSTTVMDSYRQTGCGELIPVSLKNVQIDDNPILAIYKLK